MKPVFALIDCNNFFVSCERLFRPDLANRPVVVLSSNDGCVISRSNEAKALGIPMGAPAFKYKYFFKQQGIVQFSANFELYGDISQRITRLLTSITSRTEVYSVDESFLDLNKLLIRDYTQWGLGIRQRLLQAVGIPVAIGIAPTKTLAKLASEQAKQNTNLGGVLSLHNRDPDHVSGYLAATPLKDVWGIGRRLEPKLKAEGVFNALDLARMRPQRARQLMGINGQQLVAELNGQVCHELAAFDRVRQSVMNGRTFGEDTHDFKLIEAAIASLVARAAFSLRREGLLAKQAALQLNTNRHKPGYQQQGQTLRLATPSADTGHLTSRLVEVARQLFKPGPPYHRANVMFYDLINQGNLQPDLLGDIDVQATEQASARSEAHDLINQRFGRKTIYYAAEDLGHSWQPKHQLASPRYTTNWQELPIAKLSG